MTDAYNNSSFLNTPTTEEAAPDAASRKWEIRPLVIGDIAPVTRIISALGVREFAPLLQSEQVMSVFRKAAAKDSPTTDDFTYAGITAVVEIAGVVLANYHRCESDLTAFLAGLTGTAPEEIAALPMEEFPGLIKAVVSSKGFSGFFAAALRFAK
jgi:hypothetical protein